MATVSEMTCACEPCSCVVKTDTAVAKDGKYYCTDACANGHPEGSEACGKSGCGCGTA
ncbi:MAG: metallothionein [Cyanobacteria bacterium P01_F01_bin.153]